MKNRIFLKVMYLTIITVFSCALMIAYANSNPRKAQQQKQGNTKWEAPASADTLVNPLAGNSKAAEAGENLFTIYCATCHGNKGKGNGIQAATLNPKPKDLTSKKVQKESDGALFWKITTGKPPMVSWKYTLTETQRWQVVDYIRQLAKK
jgi:mono/diheme cytochrome c family protein